MTHLVKTFLINDEQLRAMPNGHGNLRLFFEVALDNLDDLTPEVYPRLALAMPGPFDIRKNVKLTQDQFDAIKGKAKELGTKMSIVMRLLVQMELDKELVF